jgi:putative membrane protein
MARVEVPAWTPHPDVWLLVGGLVAGYAVAVVRVGPRLAPNPRRPVTRLQQTALGAAAFAVLLASDWPIHDVAEGYLFSVHMLQHFVYTTVVAPLLLIATPAWMARALLSRLRALGSVRRAARFLPATVIFNAVLIATHLPPVVARAVGSPLVHFGVHTVVLVSALIVWLPVLSPLPEVPRLFAPLGMLYLFLQSILPTVPAAWLAYNDKVLYRVYESFDRLWGVSALSDMRLAGVVMKTATGAVLWIVIAIVFFRWYADEEPDRRPGRITRNLDQELLGLHQQATGTR